MALVLRAIEAFKVFDIIYVMTRGGPADATKTASFFVYQESFTYLQRRQRRRLCADRHGDERR